MRKTLITGAAIVAMAFSLTACSATQSTAETSPSASSSPSSTAAATDSRSGSFSGLNGQSAAGTASISGGKLVLSGFSSSEGPDLHVYLTSGTDEAAVTAGKEISGVAFDKASQTFDLAGIDTGSYTDVVIHCDKAKAVFGAAALS
ncbi:DM13 domain-containing protein [Leifsonia sp. SIMBA_070]|uniref:DM13 domain-containing protein n=1 Tax=Leifsonia sp. SIMBA_070 TaxID=3085810 RepID=UPI00397A3DD8